MERPLVSIIIPAFNAGKYIEETLKSVLNQTWSPLEIVVINDGSVDSTEDIICSFNDDRIKYFKEENKGQCIASNIGIKKSSGEYIKFCDADDIMNPCHIEAQMAKLNYRQDVICFCSWGRFKKGIEDTKWVEEVYCKDSAPIEWLKLSMSCKYDMMPAWFWLIPRQLLKKSGGWNEQLSLNNDFEFSIRLLINASFVTFAKEAKMYYRSHQKESLSKRVSEKAYSEAILSSKMGCASLLKIENTKQMRLLCANKFSFWLYEIYPKYPLLVKQLEKEIKQLGGSNRTIDDSRLMHILQRFVGWKIAKRLKSALYYLGYKKYIFKIKK